MKILAVDDDALALDILSAVLCHANYDNLTFSMSAQAALKEIHEAETRFDCLLLDIRMPGMDGIELCSKVRAMEGYEDIPIIMITAVSDKVQLNRAIEAGATDYISKPFDGLELGTRLRAAERLADLLKETRNNDPDATSATENNVPVLRVCDAIALEPGRGILDLESLHISLLSLPSGVYSTVILGFSVINIQEIFDTVPAVRFRAFLNEIARAIAEELPTSKFHIAYAGNGVFAVVLHGARFQKPVVIKRKIRIALDRLEPPIMPQAKSDGVEVVFGNTTHRGALSGDNAAIALSIACRTAQIAAQAHEDCSRLSKLRHTIRGETTPDGGSTFESQMQYAKTAVSKIIPRRVASNIFGYGGTRSLDVEQELSSVLTDLRHSHGGS